ncbi:unnamed protein product [Vitrella brassicaformis CCMP3155]|uniref:Phosphatidylinositol-3,4,5-trisphosphate 3-phosphatase n=1 Tax=Vitrella brassicaformis (strain CCMP3155) TaxID=1169540 RepID=A0A0G4GYG0_VITBC|nr:unnamed protein product [Vitrella brassicaformis CCMP3155]|mmetsp:Transcript_38556/g.110268  ORF Transcript_38556/g.110268 Transcript_38556/m.110268 type:complete len:530 (-) Transcript_38556:297-1886(-)|eukprot:CEM36154.1 unnamed protein product [Vitrella brassicaformis CCMP3155]
MHVLGRLADRLKDFAETVADSITGLGVDGDAYLGPTAPVYIHRNIIAIPFPSHELLPDLAEVLNANHGSNYLVLNMSERTYDASRFNGQIVDVQFRGMPSPPLDLLLKLCVSSSQWLLSDAQNVIVVHCYHGFSRTAVFIASFLSWIGLCKNPHVALQKVCEVLGLTSTPSPRVVLPSQWRYLHYFARLQRGEMPEHASLMLRRILINGIPVLSPPIVVHDSLVPAAAVAFRPFYEVWQAGELIYSSLPEAPTAAAPPPADAQPQPSNGQPDEHTADGQQIASEAMAALSDHREAALPGYAVEDGTVRFECSLKVTGDVLLRVRHQADDGTKCSAFRAAFHTAFVPNDTLCLKLGLSELDGAAGDVRFPADFFVDLMFEPSTDPDDDGERVAALRSLVTRGQEKAQEVKAELLRRVRARKDAEKRTAQLEELRMRAKLFKEQAEQQTTSTRPPADVDTGDERNGAMPESSAAISPEPHHVDLAHEEEREHGDKHDVEDIYDMDWTTDMLSPKGGNGTGEGGGENDDGSE